MRADYFGEDVASRYDVDEAEMFDPARVQPGVEFLSRLARIKHVSVWCKPG